MQVTMGGGEEGSLGEAKPPLLEALKLFFRSATPAGHCSSIVQWPSWHRHCYTGLMQGICDGCKLTQCSLQ